MTLQENATTAQDQDEYNRRYNALVSQHKTVKGKMDRAQKLIAEKAGQRHVLEAFQRAIKEADHLLEFNEGLFAGTVESIISIKQRNGIKGRYSVLRMAQRL